jgi:hypothetical protein
LLIKVNFCPATYKLKKYQDYLPVADGIIYHKPIQQLSWGYSSARGLESSMLAIASSRAIKAMMRL